MKNRRCSDLAPFPDANSQPKRPLSSGGCSPALWPVRPFRRLWLVPVACMCLLGPCASQAEEQLSASANASSAELPFRLDSGYLIEVEGRIGGQAKLRFILDTGATISIIDRRIAQDLKLDAQTAQSYNFDRNLKWKTATVPEVEFGPIRAANVRVLVGDLAGYSDFARKADAVIGMDLLGLSDVTIDFAAGKLIFDPSAIKTYSAGGDPGRKCLVVELKVQDRPVHLILDTGLQGILLYEQQLRKSVPGLRTAGSIRNGTMGGRLQVKQAVLPDVVFGNRNRQVPVVLLPSSAPDMLQGIDGMMGIAALQARRVHFDFSRQTFSWE
jgi:predicted aspartyl protease